MTRRLTLAILGTTVAALVLAGLATLLLARVSTRRGNERELRHSAEALVQDVTDLAERPRPALLAAVRGALRLQGAEVLVVGPAGGINGTLPAGVSRADLNVPLLRTGRTVSGSNGDLIYAAAPASSSRGTIVAVLTRRVSGFGSATGWFLLAAGVTIALSAVVAVSLGRRLTRPLREADLATRRIAAGELSTRVPEPTAKADDELADLARSINVMASNLERSQGLEQQFLLSVSHDLRTPLTSIQGYAEAITDGVIADPREGAAVILSESRRLDRLVGDLLDLARLEARTFSLHVQRVDLAAVAAATVVGFQPDASASGLTVGEDVGAAAPVLADADRLAQVVANLIDNAMKFARTTVTVGVTAGSGQAVLWVDDDGPGIAEADRPHVFERLYVTRHEPTRRESGSGLGLAIVRELAEAMGGSAVAEAAPGSGARLVVRLPLATAPPPPA